jgi:hypothetical protein
MKRPTPLRYVSRNSVSGTTFDVLRIPVYPLDGGSYFINARDAMSAGATVIKMVCYQTPFTWFRSMYYGIRGGMRYKLKEVGTGNNYKVHTLLLGTTTVGSNSDFKETTGILPTFDTYTRGVSTHFSQTSLTTLPPPIIQYMNTQAGIQPYNPSLSSMAEVDIPMQNPYNFVLGQGTGDPIDFERYLGAAITNRSCQWLTISFPTTQNISIYDRFLVYQSIAEDFSFSGLLCTVPTLYYPETTLRTGVDSYWEVYT